MLTDANGVSEEDNAYYPYGDTYTHTGTSDVAYKYTGQELDNETGLYFYEARYYDPVLGRFISPDTIVPDPMDPQALNRYSYVRNNPIIYTDPTGHAWWNDWWTDLKNDWGWGRDTSAGSTGSSASSNNFAPADYTLETVQVTATPLPSQTGSQSNSSPFGVDYSHSGIFSAPNVYEFAFGPEAVGQQRPALSNTAVETATLFGTGVVFRGGLKLLSLGSKGRFGRIVPGGGLAAHEGAGGHLLARHVGQTAAQLSSRLASEPGLKVASSF